MREVVRETMREISPDNPLYCPRCGGLHEDRSLYSCAQCSAPLCARETTRLPGDSPRAHFENSQSVHPTFCGYAFPTTHPLT